MTLGHATLRVGDSLAPIAKLVSAEKIAAFQAAEPAASSTPVNALTRESRARATGLAAAVAPEQMCFAYLHELLDRQFGADFRQGGRLSVNFLKPVRSGDTVTAHGVVTARDEMGHRSRFLVELWLESQQGEKTCAGQAEVTVPSPLT